MKPFTLFLIKCNNCPAISQLHLRVDKLNKLENIDRNLEFIKTRMSKITANECEILRSLINSLKDIDCYTLENEDLNDIEKEKQLVKLYDFLLSNEVVEGLLVCKICGVKYKIKDSIADFINYECEEQ
ncbi:Multifunctional methyltransferase subunit trm112 [Astathelohania contejeani]|uniref:Multifunctional methyltransferase subunit trm112 n=1 Tax=Astathelohania contejeani TaxID=164912 RepID=A0ABQ7HZR9_9MICR|nr:Multifunctional methyltransferase subunit trm112 [Thelohania contejeani]